MFGCHNFAARSYLCLTDLDGIQEECPSYGVPVFVMRHTQRIALRKLIMIDNAECLNDLKIPPANHLEKLSGDRQGQYSIRINDQYRICFSIDGRNFVDVEIVDYH